MTTADYNKAVASAIKLIVANNGGKVAYALRSAGYETKDYVESPELEMALFQLHSVDPKKFYQLLSTVPWNSGNHNWTNEPKYRDEIMKLVGDASGSQVARGNWWDIFLTLLQPQVPPQVMQEYVSERGWQFWLGMTAIVFLLGLIIYLGIKFIK